MKNWIGVSMAALLAAVAIPARAEPAPAPAIDPGRYDTPWGAGEMKIVGATAIFTLDDGSVFWGSLGNAGREWNGRWVRAPQPARADRAHRPCSSPRGPVPSSFPVPSGGFWGRFAAHSLRSNGPRALALDWSGCADAPVRGASRFNLVQTAPRPLTQAAVSGRALPSPPYDGPCTSVSSRSVATITPCTLDFARPFRITLKKDMQKAVGRITFTPLVDDPPAVATAIRSNTVLPIHPTEGETYQVVRGGKLHRRGSWADVTPPATICQHDYWIVNVIDGNGQRHPGNGVIGMRCGPNRIGRSDDFRPVEPLRPRE